MQRLQNSNAANPGLGQPIVVVDAQTLSRIAGGAGLQGGLSLGSSTATNGTGAPGLYGPHGGWRATVLGPHGGW